MIIKNYNINDLIDNAGVYMITNLITNRKYIGSTLNLFRRYNDHIKYCSNYELRKDLETLTSDNFTFEVLNIFNKTNVKTLLNLEQVYLNQYFAKEYKESKYTDIRFRELLYNYLPDASNSVAYKEWKEESKKLLSEKRKGKGNIRYGKHLTEEQKLKMSISIKEGFRNGRINPNQGKKTSDEKKRNIIEGQKRGGKIKTIYSLNLKTKVVIIHESISKASIDTTVDKADIGRIVKGKQLYSKNYYFSYDTIINVDYIINSILSIKKDRQVKNNSLVIRKQYKIEKI